MKALILNSGTGSRMGDLTNNKPKCLTEISEKETILSNQLKLLNKLKIKEIVITTGLYHDVIEKYCRSLKLNLNFKFVKNLLYDKTNYIYSIYLAREYLNDDLIMMHGDLVFNLKTLTEVINHEQSCMAVSTTAPIPEKDFKAVCIDQRIQKIGINFFDNAIAAQPLYKLLNNSWKIWLDHIILFCKNENVNCYAENAFNEISNKCKLFPCDVQNELCCEIDTPTDLENLKRLKFLKFKKEDDYE